MTKEEQIEQLVEYIIEALDTLFPGNTTPEPYPHTNPIREVPVSGRVKVKKK